MPWALASCLCQAQLYVSYRQMGRQSWLPYTTLPQQPTLPSTLQPSPSALRTPLGPREKHGSSQVRACSNIRPQGLMHPSGRLSQCPEQDSAHKGPCLWQGYWLPCVTTCSRGLDA